MTALLLQRPLRLLDQRLEDGGFGGGEFSQLLAVELDAGALEAVHETPVGHAVLAGSCVDALDPERAEFALPRLAVAVSVAQGFFDFLDCDPEIGARSAAIAFGELDDFLVPGVRGDAP